MQIKKYFKEMGIKMGKIVSINLSYEKNDPKWENKIIVIPETQCCGSDNRLLNSIS